TISSPSRATVPGRPALSATQNPGSATSDQTRSSGAAISTSRSMRSSLICAPSLPSFECNSRVAHQTARRNPRVAPERWASHVRQNGAGSITLHWWEGARMPTLERHDDVFVLALGDNENRFHPDWIAAVNGALDEVKKADGARALVTAATGKFFSNGLDLEWLGTNPDRRQQYVDSVHELFARVLC